MNSEDSPPVAARFYRALLLSTLAVPLLTATASSAQSPSSDDITRSLDQIQRDTRLRISPDLTVDDRAILDYGAFLTTAYLSTDNAQDQNRAVRLYDLNLYSRVNLDGAHEFFVRSRIHYQDFNPGDASPTDPDGLYGFLEEAYYRFDLARYLAAYDGVATPNNLTVTAGRQFVQWASGLTLAQYLDGGLIQGNLGNLGVTLIAGVTPYPTTDFDSSRPYYDKSTYRGYYGGMLSYQAGAHRPYAYVLVERDYNKDRRIEIAGAEVQYDYNAYYIGIGSDGALSDRLQYNVEFVYEGGSTLSAQTFTEDGLPVPQSDNYISAFAAQASLDFLLGDIRRSRLGAGVIVASGDDDRGRSSQTLDGNEPGTADNAFNALGIATAGFAFAPPVSNLIVLRGSASTFPWGDRSGPMGRLQLGTDLLVYGKTLTDAPIDESTSDDRYLGVESSVYLNWQIVEDVTLQVRYAAFVPGDAIEDSSSVRQYLYTALTFAF